MPHEITKLVGFGFSIQMSGSVSLGEVSVGLDTSLILTSSKFVFEHDRQGEVFIGHINKNGPNCLC